MVCIRIIPKVRISPSHKLQLPFFVTNTKCLKLVEKLIAGSLTTNSISYGIFTSNTGR